jgi:ABC-type cobalamin/Fe3+-siderophores transport system ATPase subunit
MALPINSLEIEGFRALNRLTLPKLGRVNLFVGKNNSGKSSLLEAIRILVTRASVQVLSDILMSRDEMARDRANNPDDHVDQRMIAFQQLFHGRCETWGESPPIRIGDDRVEGGHLTIRMDWLSGSESGPRPAGPVPLFEGERRPMLTISGLASRYIPIDVDPRHLLGEAGKNTRHAFVGPNGLSSREATDLWDQIALTALEVQVVRTLRIITPEIEQIAAVGERGLERVIVARVAQGERPVPLRSMGDGMNRLLGIALGMVTAQDGVLLLDEVENGIHFSVQKKLWELIFRESHRLNVQVFATTHSWDCIDAFQRAAQQAGDDEAALVRLSLQGSEVAATILDEGELSIATREHIEVR